MKWVLFFIAVLAAFPVGHWLRDRLPLQHHAWTLIGFLPFYSALNMALISFNLRPGDTNGIEVALIDWLVLSLFFAQKGPGRPLPYRFALAAYLLVAIVSATQAQWTMGAFGYVWKLCRMYLLFAVVCRAAHDEQVPTALLRGMMFGILYECAWSVWQHYVLGIHQVTGSFAHQNTLGILENLIVMVAIALVLAGNATKLETLAPFAALLTCFFTVSRGALFFFGAGSVLVYLVSSIRTYNLRKATIGFTGLVLGPAIIALALAMLSSRLPEEQTGSLMLRQQYKSAASMMLQEHPLGIGPNHFTVMLLVGGYGDRAGVDWSQRVAIVHNIYWLTAAEMGYAGVVALVVLFLAPLLSAFRYSFKARQDLRGDILLGLGVGLAVFYAHCFFEWVWRDAQVSYLYWMIVAMIASLARQIRDRLPGTISAPGNPASTGSPRGESLPLWCGIEGILYHWRFVTSNRAAS